MKKQFNYYMDEQCKDMIDCIRKNDPMHIEMCSDSQIIERLLRKYAERYGWKDKNRL